MTLIDVSNHQGVIAWQATAPAIDGAYIKVTEGVEFVDSWWRANHDAASGNRVPTGAYHFADLDDPVVEANHFADQYVTAGWQLRPVLDIETNGATAAWIRAFREQFRTRTGSPRFRVYSSLSLLTGALNPAGWIDADTDIWVAAYRSVLGWWHPQLALWQNTSAARIPGVLGNVDEDQFQNGWTPAADFAIPVPPKEAYDMTNPQTLPYQADFDNAAFPIECGDSSAVVAEQWVTLLSTFGSSDYELIVIDGGVPGRPFDGPVRYDNGAEAPSKGTLGENSRLYAKFTSGSDGLALRYKNNSPGARLGISFPHLPKN